MQDDARKRWLRGVAQATFSLLAIALGGTAAYLLIQARAKPAVELRPDFGPLVTVETVVPRDVSVEVRGHGTVRPKVEAELVAQVSGRVTAVHPSLVVGGLFRADDVLVEIDPTDYKLALDRAQAAVERAKVALELERAEADVARSEWESMNPGVDPPTPLVLRIPQIRKAEADRQAAEAEVRAAEVNLERTKLSLPFNGRILSEQVDPGEFLTVGKSVATAYGTDALEIHLPLEDRELRWFDLPVGEEAGPPANGRHGVPTRIEARFAGSTHTWEGRALRTLGSVDPKSRMVTVVVEVAETFASGGNRPALVPGMFVEVAIEGTTLSGVFPVPRRALREGGTLWVAEDGHLRIRPAGEIVRQDRTHAYLKGELVPGARVITSPLDVVTDGMRIRTAPESGAPDPAPEAKEPPVSRGQSR